MSLAVRPAARFAAAFALCLAGGSLWAAEPQTPRPSLAGTSTAASTARQTAEALPAGRFRTALLAELAILDARRPAPERPAAASDARATATPASFEPPGWIDPFADAPTAQTVRQRQADQAAARRLQAERLAAERQEAERLEQERLEAARAEAERLEAERLERERLEAERQEAERLEAERLEAERLEAERLKAERLEAEKLEREQAEADRLAAERAEAERLEAERLQAERLEAERAAAARKEAERQEAARQEAARNAVHTPAYGRFCPVSLRNGKRLVLAAADVTAAYDDSDWHFADAAAKEAFEADPTRYLPVGGGRDVVLEALEGFRAPGRPDLCVIYRDRLYLFASARTRAAFVKEPKRFVPPAD